MFKLVFKQMDWQEAFKKTMDQGTAFLIDTSIDYVSRLDNSDIKEIKRIFSEDGIFSYKFGFSNQIDGNDPILKKMYTCKCHYLYDIDNLGKVCHKCNTYVRRSIPARCGWIDLGNNYVLHPIICAHLVETTRKVQFDLNGRILRDGETISPVNELNSVNDTVKKRKRRSSKNKDDQFSLFDLLTKRKLKYTWEDILYNGKLNEFIDMYIKDPKRLALIKGITNPFTNKIMVINSGSRPIKIKKVLNIPEIKQDPLNNYYMSISNSAKILINRKVSNVSTAIRTNHLVSIMKNLVDIKDAVHTNVADNKKSLLRGLMFSRRKYNSSRLVIVPIVNTHLYRTDIVELPITVFRGIFTKDIHSILDQYNYITSEFRNKIVDVNRSLTLEEIKFVKEKIFPKVKHPYVKIIREPAMYKTSVIANEIVNLTYDEYNAGLGQEMVLRIPFQILPAIAGDFKCAVGVFKTC